MSGKPSPDGVASVVSLLDRIAQLDAEIEELRPQAERLRTVETERANLQADVTKNLKAMDVHAEQKGNWGWESRLAWFLAEMRRNATAVKP